MSLLMTCLLSFAIMVYATYQRYTCFINSMQFSITFVYIDILWSLVVLDSSACQTVPSASARLADSSANEATAAGWSTGRLDGDQQQHAHLYRSAAGETVRTVGNIRSSSSLCVQSLCNCSCHS